MSHEDLLAERDAKIQELTKTIETNQTKLQSWKEKVKAMSDKDMATIADLNQQLAHAQKELLDRTAHMQDWKQKMKLVMLDDEMKVKTLTCVGQESEGRRSVEGSESEERIDIVIQFTREMRQTVVRAVERDVMQVFTKYA
eukprot:PhF_6_TR7744/c0_g1_i1/m.11209